ncbi:putative DUF26 domain-containing protein 2 precursor [Hibiscus syriacus]|uniref:DUF26 domain-containing protein 2 n=1 Tax=Hibiscus syriacus TaxID=106335 RepID=A0A6A2WWC8_HIBSY|nr:bZIP transcription factor 11-like [Hibiscus syriacus]KAE8665758.1 putative DUF26 domain-containing protein 2 precursor [Hibiscus syriacus]
MFSSGSKFDNYPFPAFENGFTPWDHCPELFSTFQTIEPGAILGYVLDEPTPDQNNSNSGSEEPNQPDSSLVDERKRRRMISNRESARRSRMRKQKHLENLRNQVNRLRAENRELTNRLRSVLYHCHRATTDNDRLRYEHSFLRRKLSDIHQILTLKQLQQFSSAWPFNNVVTVMSDRTPPLIT